MKKGFESLQILKDFRENSAGKVECLETSDYGKICGVSPKLHGARTRCAVFAGIDVRAGTGGLSAVCLCECGRRADAAAGGEVDWGAVRDKIAGLKIQHNFSSKCSRSEFSAGERLRCLEGSLVSV